MKFSEAIKRELEVAFSKHSQPIWFRILKYIVLGLLIYFLWGTNALWIVLLISSAFIIDPFLVPI